MRSAIRSFALTALFAAAAFLLPAGPASADTPNFSIAIPGIQVMPVNFAGQVGADKTDAVTIKLPFAAQVIGVSATARASGGSSPTLAIDVLDDGETILSAPIAVTAGTVSEGSILSTAAIVADESLITIDLDLGGSSPTWDDITVTLTLARR